MCLVNGGSLVFLLLHVAKVSTWILLRKVLESLKFHILKPVKKPVLFFQLPRTIGGI